MRQYSPIICADGVITGGRDGRVKIECMFPDGRPLEVLVDVDGPIVPIAGAKVKLIETEGGLSPYLIRYRAGKRHLIPIPGEIVEVLVVRNGRS